MDALTRSMSDTIGNLQMALRVVRELIDEGPGTPGALAERMTEKDEDGLTFSEEHVSEAVGILDQWSLLSFPEFDTDPDSEVVGLWS